LPNKSNAINSLSRDHKAYQARGHSQRRLLFCPVHYIKSSAPAPLPSPTSAQYGSYNENSISRAIDRIRNKCNALTRNHEFYVPVDEQNYLLQNRICTI